MRARVALIAGLVASLAACAARTPPPLDISHLERRDLVARVLADPRDVQAHLALAALDDTLGRPGEALEQLQIVENLGGPLGVRWHDDDRARIGRLLVARARVRIARGAPTALGDLQHATKLGMYGLELADAQAALAISELRHIDGEVRAHGRALLGALAGSHPEWRGALAGATPDEHGRFGAWLWEVGARREAYEQLARWSRTSSEPGALRDAWEVARAWWTPGSLPQTRTAAAASQLPARHADGDPRALGAAIYAHARFIGAPEEDALLDVARAFQRDVNVGERLGRDLVAAQPDEAAGHAALGALYDALGEPARARVEWQAAVDGSSEPLFLRGLAEAAARTHDGAAALIFATQAAAAWGDPAVVWIGVGDTLEAADDHVSALVCARSAVDLAGPDTLPHAIDLAITASHALGRQAQVDGLRVQRLAAEPLHKPEPTDPAAAVLAYHTLPTAGTVARMWVAARTHPADLDVRLALLGALPADDPRRATIVGDVLAFAGDADAARALAAVRALR